MGAVTIREATGSDFPGIWPIFREVVAVGDTYAIAPDTSYEDAFLIWMALPARTYVALAGGEILGTYFLKTNHDGPGDHVGNCGYMVASRARGRGVARAMCEHSQAMARALGYQALQFNLVVETNEGAVRLWERLGFAIVGTVPRAFRHPAHGYVGAHVMFKWLGGD